MPRIVVIGGHGRTGRLIVEQLRARGDVVVATIRNPAQAPALEAAGARPAVLDLDRSSVADFAAAFAGADAVVFTAGSAEGETSEIDRLGTFKTVEAAEKAGVRRYVTVSSLGDSTPFPEDWSSPEMLDYFAAKRAGSARIRASGLDWTIIEPGELTDAAPAGRIALSQTGIDNAPIPRADVAATVIAVLDSAASIGKTFQIVAGDTPIDAAVKAAA